MLKARHKDLHPLLKAAEWLLIMVVSTAVVFVLWQVLPINHGSTGALLLFQALQAIGLFIVPPFVVAYLWSDWPLEWLRIVDSRKSKTPHCAHCLWGPCTVESRKTGRLVLLSIGIMLTALPLINLLVSWNEQIRLPESLNGLEQLMQQLEAQADQLLQNFLTYGNGAWWVLLLNLLVLAVLPAIGEELTFRGVLQQLLYGQPSTLKPSNSQTLKPSNSQTLKPSNSQTLNPHLAVWVTAFIFSFIHFQFYGFIPRLLLGALLGYVLLWSGNIRYSMIMHGTNNALSVLLFYLGTYVWDMSQEQIDALGTEHTWWLTLVCTPLMLAQVYAFRKGA
ncbi:MAG: CPBP family intramembrane metalloprotease [Paludibacteraceae bacterium]|nr:CPBP family intramembrane metalloprotease [Paludibacteraceae bacterium]